MGLAAPAVREGETGVAGEAMGDTALVADGVIGVVGTWEEPS